MKLRYITGITIWWCATNITLLLFMTMGANLRSDDAPPAALYCCSWQWVPTCDLMMRHRQHSTAVHDTGCQLAIWWCATGSTLLLFMTLGANLRSGGAPLAALYCCSWHWVPTCDLVVRHQQHSTAVHDNGCQLAIWWCATGSTLLLFITVGANTTRPTPPADAH